MSEGLYGYCDCGRSMYSNEEREEGRCEACRRLAWLEEARSMRMQVAQRTPPETTSPVDADEVTVLAADECDELVADLHDPPPANEALGDLLSEGPAPDPVDYAAWWRSRPLRWRIHQRMWWRGSMLWSALAGRIGPGERILLDHIEHLHAQLDEIDPGAPPPEIAGRSPTDPFRTHEPQAGSFAESFGGLERWWAATEPRSVGARLGSVWSALRGRPSSTEWNLRIYARVLTEHIERLRRDRSC